MVIKVDEICICELGESDRRCVMSYSVANYLVGARAPSRQSTTSSPQAFQMGLKVLERGEEYVTMRAELWVVEPDIKLAEEQEFAPRRQLMYNTFQLFIAW